MASDKSTANHQVLGSVSSEETTCGAPTTTRAEEEADDSTPSFSKVDLAHRQIRVKCSLKLSNPEPFKSLIQVMRLLLVYYLGRETELQGVTLGSSYHNYS